MNHRERFERHRQLPRRDHAPSEVEYEYPAATSRLDVARLLLDVVQFGAEVYDRWIARKAAAEKTAPMTPAQAREYAHEILAAADKAEANDRDGEDWGAP